MIKMKKSKKVNKQSKRKPAIKVIKVKKSKHIKQLSKQKPTNKVVKYWTNWNEILNITEERQEEFWLKFRDEFKRNYPIYRTWSNVKLYTTLAGIANRSKVKNRHLVLKFIRKFVTDFMDITSLEQGILLVDNIIDSIRSGDKPNAVQLTTSLMHPKKAKKHNPSPTPTLRLKGLKHLNIPPHTKLFNMHVDWTVKEIWQDLFDEIKGPKYKKDLEKWINKTKGITYIQRVVIKRFKKEWNEVEKIEKHLSKDYHAKITHTDGSSSRLSLHQKVVAYYAKMYHGFLDLGDTGVGKTWSAQTAIALLNSKRNVIFVPANIVDQWKLAIESTFDNAIVYTQRDILKKEFKAKSKGKAFYICSYQTISRSSGTVILNRLKRANPSFVIIDEGQRIKVRDEKTISRCRVKIHMMLDQIRRKRTIRTLMLTATPAPNTVAEVKSLVEIVSGKEYKNISSFSSLPNLAAMHAELSRHSLRYPKIYRNGKKEIKVRYRTIQCRRNFDLHLHRRVLGDVGFLGMDQIAMDVKIPYIIKELRKMLRKNPKEKVVIFTKYVTEILPMLRRALDRYGISHTEYTGSNKKGIDPKLGAEFFNGKQVLLASSAVAEGLDKLQNYCHRIWFVGHGWTFTERQQVIGRLYRNGQKKNVQCLTFLAVINGIHYDQKVKIDRINHKRTVHDTVVNGVFSKDAIPIEYNLKDFLEKVIKAKPKNVKRVINATLTRSLNRQAEVAKTRRVYKEKLKRRLKKIKRQKAIKRQKKSKRKRKR